VLQPTSADPVSPLLVFLHLLKSDSEGISQVLLAHVEHHSAHAKPASDMLVDQV
jgi:hypothetical protein